MKRASSAESAAAFAILREQREASELTEIARAVDRKVRLHARQEPRGHVGSLTATIAEMEAARDRLDGRIAVLTQDRDRLTAQIEIARAKLTKSIGGRR